MTLPARPRSAAHREGEGRARSARHRHVRDLHRLREAHLRGAAPRPPRDGPVHRLQDRGGARRAVARARGRAPRGARRRAVRASSPARHGLHCPHVQEDDPPRRSGRRDDGSRAAGRRRSPQRRPFHAARRNLPRGGLGEARASRRAEGRSAPPRPDARDAVAVRRVRHQLRRLQGIDADPPRPLSLEATDPPRQRRVMEAAASITRARGARRACCACLRLERDDAGLYPK